MKMFLLTFYLKLRKKSIVHIKKYYIYAVIWGRLDVGELVGIEIMRASRPFPLAPLLRSHIFLVTVGQS